MAKVWYYLKSIFELVFGFKNWLTVIRIFLNLDKNLPVPILLKKSNIAMWVRSKMDIWSIKETFIDRFYSKYGCELEDGWTVIDIGAAIGEFSIFGANMHPNIRVIAYEPFPESVEILRKNLDLNKITNVKVIPAAVWKTSTTLKLDLSLLEPLQISSSTRLSADQADNGINVQAVSLDEVFASNQLQQVDLVKLDCEGAEFDIILESDADTIRSIKRFIMEYHDSLPGRHHSQLVSHLEQLGYRVVATGNVVHPEIGYLFAEQIR